MAISGRTKQIADRLYTAFGTDTGIIFGITSRKAVEAIIQQTLAIELDIEDEAKRMVWLHSE